MRVSQSVSQFANLSEDTDDPDEDEDEDEVGRKRWIWWTCWIWTWWIWKVSIGYWLNMVDIYLKDMDVYYERLVDVVNIDVLDAVDTNMAGYVGYRWRIWVALVSKEAEANEKSWGQDLFFSHQVLLSRLRFDWFSIYTPHDVSPPLSRLWPVIRLIGLQVPPPHSVGGEKSLGCKSSSIQAPRMAYNYWPSISV